MFFLHIDRKSKNQSLEEATKIVKKYCELKKEGYHGDKFLSICPTNLHWMAILNDSKAIEVNIKSNYYFASTVKFLNTKRIHGRTLEQIFTRAAL